LGFAIARVVVLLSLGSGGVLDAAMGPCKGKGASEQTLCHGLVPGLDKGDILLADRYYCSYVMLALLQALGVDAVFQQHQRRRTDFRKGQHLGTRDHVVVWSKPKQKPKWLDQASFDALPETLRVRETHVGSKVLVSTL